MGVIVNKENDQNDELSRRIAADLEMRGVGSGGAEVEGATKDFVDQSDYMKDMKRTSKFGWVWIVLIVLAILSIVSIIFL